MELMVVLVVLVVLFLELRMVVVLILARFMGSSIDQENFYAFTLFRGIDACVASIEIDDVQIDAFRTPVLRFVRRDLPDVIGGWWRSIGWLDSCVRDGWFVSRSWPHDVPRALYLPSWFDEIGVAMGRLEIPYSRDRRSSIPPNSVGR